MPFPTTKVHTVGTPGYEAPELKFNRFSAKVGTREPRRVSLLHAFPSKDRFRLARGTIDLLLPTLSYFFFVIKAQTI